MVEVPRVPMFTATFWIVLSCAPLVAEALRIKKPYSTAVTAEASISIPLMEMKSPPEIQKPKSADPPEPVGVIFGFAPTPLLRKEMELIAELPDAVSAGTFSLNV